MIRSLDHLIFATNDIAAAAEAWAHAFDVNAEAPYQPEGSHLQLARMPFERSAFLELAQPTSDAHRVARFLADRGEGMFSISVAVDDLDATVAGLRSRSVQVSDPEPGAWPGTRLARIPRGSANGVAIQLIERA